MLRGVPSKILHPTTSPGLPLPMRRQKVQTGRPVSSLSSPTSTTSATHPGRPISRPLLRTSGSVAALCRPLGHQFAHQRRWGTTMTVGIAMTREEAVNMMCQAAERGQLRWMQQAEEAGIPVDEAGATGQTPATAAAESGQARVLGQLHQWGVPLDKPDGNGETPADLARSVNVMFALFLANALKMEQLVPQEDISVDDLMGYSMEECKPYGGMSLASHLKMLWRREHLANEAMEELVQQLGQILMQDAMSDGARGQPICIPLSVPMAAFDTWNEEEEGSPCPRLSLLHVLAFVGEMQHHIGLKYDLDMIQPDTLLTPLGIAARLGHAEVVDHLAQKGVILDLPCIDGSTPLQAAIAFGHDEVANVLRSHGAQPPPPEAYPCPILASAAAGQGNYIRILAPHAPLTSTDDRGRTAAHLAAAGSHIEALEALVKVGAPLNELDHEGHTPLSTAVMEGDPDSVAALAEAGVPLNTSEDSPSLALAAAYLGHERVVRVLGRYGAPMTEEYGPEGITPLAAARSRGWRGVEEALLEASRG